jgi:hypothetical protein
MKPMELFSTQFISYDDIRVEEIELIEDAWGMRSEFYDVFSLLDQLKIQPEPELGVKLIGKIRNQN